MSTCSKFLKFVVYFIIHYKNSNVTKNIIVLPNLHLYCIGKISNVIKGIINSIEDNTSRARLTHFVYNRTCTLLVRTLTWHCNSVYSPSIYHIVYLDKPIIYIKMLDLFAIIKHWKLIVLFMMWENSRYTEKN